MKSANRGIRDIGYAVVVGVALYVMSQSDIYRVYSVSIYIYTLPPLSPWQGPLSTVRTVLSYFFYLFFFFLEGGGVGYEGIRYEFFV